MSTPATIGLRRWGIQDPYPLAFDITPSDGLDLRTGLTEALFIGGGGIVVAVLQNGDTCAFTCVTGQTLPLRVRRVNASGTTATLLRALYYAVPQAVPQYPGQAPSYAATVLADGPSYYWALGETTGTTAVDQVGGVNGTISGGVTLGQPGAVAGNTAMAFNGTTGKIETGGNVSLLPPWTLEGWLKITGGTYNNLLDVPSGAQDRVAVYTEGGRPTCRVTYADATPTTYITAVDPLLVAGVWTHVVVRMVGTTVSMFLDGVARVVVGNPLPKAVTGSTQPVAMGVVSGLYLTGALDEIAIYPYALSAAQIAAHYAARNTP